MTNPSNDPTLTSPTTQLSFMDKQFANMSGCGFVAVIAIIPFIALLLGIVGLIACKDPKAKQRATNMAIWGGVWFATCFFILFVMISNAPHH